MIKFIKLTVLIASFSLLIGCATTPNVKLDSSFWQDHQSTVAVAKTAPAKPGLFAAGGQGILDVAISQGVNQKFVKHLKATQMQWYTNLQDTFAKRLKSSGIKSMVYQQPINPSILKQTPIKTQKANASRDFMPMKTMIGKDRLLLIEMHSIGAIRSYYGFIPLGAPSAFCSLEGELIDLRNNRVLWRYKTKSTIGVQGKWDQPAEQFPNFTKALNTAIETASSDMLNSFFTNQ